MDTSRMVPFVALGLVLGAAALVHFYGRGGGDVAEHGVPAEQSTEAASAAGDAEAAPLDEDAREQEPSATTSAPPADVGQSAVRVFLDARGVPLERFEQALRAFEAEPRDPAWSGGMEAQFQTALAQTTLTDAESYVECRRTLCVVLFIHPPETPLDTQRPQLGLPTRAAVEEHQRLLSTLRLYGSGAIAARARNGAFVQWHRFHRRCGPEWQCLEAQR
jgi:hypothetical protein